MARLCGCPLLTDDRLRERMNLEVDEDPARFAADWEHSTFDRSWSPPGARSSLTTAGDMLQALGDHARGGEVVVLAGHGGATVDLLRSLLGDGPLEARSPGLIVEGVPGAALTRLDLVQGGWTVAQIGEDGHVAAADRSGHATGPR